MRPIKVEFQAFGPYSGHEKVDFEALSSKGLFLICGKTGIGKTMILDAMTFALYGKSSGHCRDDFYAMRCTGAEFDITTFVKFEFENNGRYYLFERRLERKRKNLSPSYNIMEHDGDGAWRTLSENPKEKFLNEKAKEIIGLDEEQFLQVMVLPQGKFERFLTSDSDEKEKILTSIFGERKWLEIADSFFKEADERKKQLSETKANIINRLKDEGCENLRELEDLIIKKKEETAQLERELKEKDYEGIIERHSGIMSLSDSFDALHKAEKNLRELEEQKPERSLWEKNLDEANRAEKVRDLLGKAEEAKDALDLRKAAETRAAEKSEEKQNAAAKALNAIKTHEEKSGENEEKKALVNQYENRREDYRGIDEAVRELKEKTAAASKCEKERKAAEKKCEEIAGLITVLNQEYDELKAEHGRILREYISGITGELAKELKEGEPCPVCGSTEHPKKALSSENSVTKAMVDESKAAEDKKYKDLQNKLDEKAKADNEALEKQSAAKKAVLEEKTAAEALEKLKSKLIPGIESPEDLEKEITKLSAEILSFDEKRKELEAAEKTAKEEQAAAKAGLENAEKETKTAQAKYEETERNAEEAVKAAGFGSSREALDLMLPEEERDELRNRIAGYDADLKSAGKVLEEKRTELSGKEEPDREKYTELFKEAQRARDELRQRIAVLSDETGKLEKKAVEIRTDSDGIDEKLREAEEDLAFAKRLRGDTGVGLQRYVLGIMFSSVVASANKMLELVHGGRYRLFCSNEKAQGKNKRGLELKVFDRNSDDQDGRFVNTLSGGEKFLASLALSIGMSTIAQRGGIRIEALFIDEGFGSLDEDSINDAMNVLRSIQEANGLVGIISHVQILRDQISCKLKVEQDGKGSHIVHTVG